MGSKGYLSRLPESTLDLDKIVDNLLEVAGVGSRVPTPQKDILDCVQLVEAGNLDLENYRRSIGDRARALLTSGMNKVLGLLDTREKIVHITAHTPPTRRNFVFFHEIGHRIIPWHHMDYDYFEDDKNILRRDIKGQFEAEANYTSSRLIFQGQRFQKEARDYELSIKTALFFSERYDSSYHSTLRYYAETHNGPCTLLVLLDSGDINPNDGSKIYKLWYSVASEKFIKKYDTNFLERFGNDFEFIRGLKKDGVFRGEINLRMLDGTDARGQIESWTNQYEVFVLICEAAPKLIKPKTVKVFSDTAP